MSLSLKVKDRLVQDLTDEVTNSDVITSEDFTDDTEQGYLYKNACLTWEKILEEASDPSDPDLYLKWQQTEEYQKLRTYFEVMSDNDLVEVYRETYYPY